MTSDFRTWLKWLALGVAIGAIWGLVGCTDERDVQPDKPIRAASPYRLHTAMDSAYQAGFSNGYSSGYGVGWSTGYASHVPVCIR